MKKTMYELLGMVKDGKELPKLENEAEKDFAYYVYEKWGNTCNLKDLKKILNDTVEILEEENKKCTVETCCMGIEGLSKALLKIKDDMKRIYENINKVEILEEEKKTKPLTKKDIEALGYACGEIQKCFTNGWTKSLENKPLEEEKKIPKKICTNRIINTKDILEFEMIQNKINAEYTYAINEIIDYLDYLKSKGE